MGCDVEVSRVVDGNPEDFPVVWSATLKPGGTPRTQVAVAADSADYDVRMTGGWPLDPGAEYAVTAGSDLEGVNIVAYELPFRLPDVTAGDVFTAEGVARVPSLDVWLSPEGPSCGKR